MSTDLPNEQPAYKDPFSEGLYNCTTGDNYLRGGEYHRLIAHLEKRATEIETLREALKAAVKWLEPGVRQDVIDGKVADFVKYTDEYKNEAASMIAGWRLL